MAILVAIPIRASSPSVFRRLALAHYAGLTYPDRVLAVDVNDLTPTGHKYETNARARNALLAAHLRPEHSHVLWLDSDLVQVPADLIERLLAVSDCDVVAPFVYVEPPGDWFYDTGGFVRAGLGAAMWPPHWDGYNGGLVELDSVGTCYLAPAALYREHGLRYAVAGDEVEHTGLLAQARARGYRVYATDAVTVLHAYLPHYGERWH